MSVWEMWKKGFGSWESATADLLEQWLKSPLVLGPSGALLSAVMKAKAAGDNATRAWWGSLGLATKHDQERELHLLNELQSRLIDLEERLAERAPGA